MRARMRDAVAVGVLLVAALAAALAWHPLGHWVALALGLAGLLVAAGVYRARRPAFPLLGTRDVLDEAEADPEAASTPRPSPGPRGPSSAG